MKVDNGSVDVANVPENHVDVQFRDSVTSKRKESGTKHFDQQVEISNVLER